MTARPVQDGEKSRLLGRVKGDAGDRLGRLDHVDRHHLGILGNGGERAITTAPGARPGVETNDRLGRRSLPTQRPDYGRRLLRIDRNASFRGHIREAIRTGGSRTSSRIEAPASLCSNVQPASRASMLRWLEASARPADGLAILTRRIRRPAERSISEDESWRHFRRLA